MAALSAEHGTNGTARPVEEWAASVRATGAGAPSLRAWWLALSGAAFAGERP